MSMFFKSTIPSSQITSEDVYRNRPRLGRISRRGFLHAGLAGLGAVGLAACGGVAAPAPATAPSTQANNPPAQAPAAKTDELGNPANSFEDITTYNNYYEFSTDKESVAALSANYKPPSPWIVEVSGLINKPLLLNLDDLKKNFGEEERVYRHRCVEGWSMVIPWNGFSLAKLIAQVQPDNKAKFVKFSSFFDSTQMPGASLPWPYVEGLRMDEAMNNLALMVTGLYGKPLPNPNGSPLRLAVPWKYGFKSIKGINKIEFVDTMPVSSWTTANAEEYGFYSNVNPSKPHPRWTQATERRIGESGRRKSLMFNGYEAQVAKLYDGLDLQANY